MSQVSLKGWAAVDGLVAAVFGYQVDQQKIPQSLRVGGVQNPAVSVFGFGGWLKNSATDGLNNWFEFAKDSLVSRCSPYFNYFYLLLHRNMLSSGSFWQITEGCM